MKIKAFNILSCLHEIPSCAKYTVAGGNLLKIYAHFKCNKTKKKTFSTDWVHRFHGGVFLLIFFFRLFNECLFTSRCVPVYCARPRFWFIHAIAMRWKLYILMLCKTSSLTLYLWERKGRDPVVIILSL